MARVEWDITLQRDGTAAHALVYSLYQDDVPLGAILVRYLSVRFPSTNFTPLKTTIDFGATQNGMGPNWGYRQQDNLFRIDQAYIEAEMTHEQKQARQIRFPVRVETHWTQSGAWDPKGRFRGYEFSPLGFNPAVSGEMVIRLPLPTGWWAVLWRRIFRALDWEVVKAEPERQPIDSDADKPDCSRLQEGIIRFGLTQSSGTDSETASAASLTISKLVVPFDYHWVFKQLTAHNRLLVIIGIFLLIVLFVNRIWEVLDLLEKLLD